MICDETVIQATKYKVKDGMELSIVEKDNGQIILQNNDENEELEIGIQKKYYWKLHEENHLGTPREIRDRLLDFQRLEIGVEGGALEFGDRNTGGATNHSPMLTSNQNAIQTSANQ